MPKVWFSLKKSLHCKSEPSKVHDPSKIKSCSTRNNHQNSTLTNRSAGNGGGRSGCSRSIANLRDVIHGSKRHLAEEEQERQQLPSCSPRSIGSSEFLNPIAHEVILHDSKCELRITGNGGCYNSKGVIGTLWPGTPGPGMREFAAAPPRRSPSVHGGNSAFSRASVDILDSVNSVMCHRCGDRFAKMEGLEAHHLSKHAVTELVEGDSSRKIVEIICRARLMKSESNFARIERVLKVHNTQKTLAVFEEYREIVKVRASKLSKKHPRCLADGNELLRFYGTTVYCSLGANGCSSLCSSEKCNTCRIIRHGFSTNKKEVKGSVGVFTTSTSGSALDSIEVYEDDPCIKKALLVCRVIAGRVHKPLENYQEFENQPGFDSFAGKIGIYSNIDELYLLNPRALLPCFVVICKT